MFNIYQDRTKDAQNFRYKQNLSNILENGQQIESEQLKKNIEPLGYTLI